MISVEPIDAIPVPPWLPSSRDAQLFFADCLPWSRVIRPTYKVRLLESVARLLPEGTASILDLGAGDGIFGSALQRFCVNARVYGVDVVRRLHPKSTIPFCTYDGKQLPFADKEFEVALLCNVLHHVPIIQRPSLFSEVARVSRRGILIKDHLAHNPMSHFSLAVADWIGNAPFGGMMKGVYLEASDWERLLNGSFFSVRYFNNLKMQTGLRNLIFPDRQEIMIQLIPNQ